LEPAAVENLNTREYLTKCRNIILENLRYLEAAPSVAFQDVPPDWAIREVEEELRAGGGSDNPDVRGEGGSGRGMLGGQSIMHGRREHEAELFENDKDQDGDRGEVETAPL